MFTMHGGLADRAHGLPITPTTRFGIASGSKGFTAVTVVGLIADGMLALDTRARELLGADLPLIDDRVTVEHLLAHRSGIGDYLDEDAHSSVTDHVMPVPVHRLATTEDFLAVLGGHPQVSEPGERFAYNNGGFVVLALLAERAAAVPFHDLVQRRVFDPAGMAGAAYLRNDELPGDVAIGYLFADGLRTNALHLPVRGSGDGGAQAAMRRPRRVLAGAVPRCPRARRVGGRDGPAAQLGPGRPDALRPRPVAARGRSPAVGGLRRRRLVPLRARSGAPTLGHGRVQLERRRLADLQIARRARIGDGTLGACRRSVT